MKSKSFNTVSKKEKQDAFTHSRIIGRMPTAVDELTCVVTSDEGAQLCKTFSHAGNKQTVFNWVKS